jgi:hypothetical protein
MTVRFIGRIFFSVDFTTCKTDSKSLRRNEKSYIESNEKSKK